jgi:type IV secretory pathway TraG/TraD family ATPase VirD4
MDGFVVDNNLPSANVNKKIDYTEAIIGGLMNAMEKPLDLFPVGHYFLAPMGIFSVIALIIAAYILSKRDLERQDAAGIEEGSSNWNDDISSFKKYYEAQYVQSMPFDPNAVLAKGLKINMDNKSINKNLNMLVIGPPGSGKSFRFIKPNMAQMNTSCIVTDPKGELFLCMAKALIKKGITVKLFSTADMKNSNCYNPFDYVYDENGHVDEDKVSTMIYLYLKNANEAKEKSSQDPFWEKSAKAFLAALIYYILESDIIRPEDRNFYTVLKLTQMGKVDEDGGSSQSKLDLLMEAHRASMQAKGIESKAMTNYDTFKLAPGKTANSILITCAVDLQLFDNINVRNLTRTDYQNDRNNVHLERLGDQQTYLFINIPAANGTFDFLVALMYSQMFETLYAKTQKTYPKKYLVMDEFNHPVVTMLDSEDDAKRAIEVIKQGKLTKVTTVSGAVYYQIKDGKRVLLENINRDIVDEIIKNADKLTVKRGGIRLPWHVRCLMDEFANITEIPNFSKLLSTMRSFEMSCVIVIQAVAQLKDRYDKRWEEIAGDCDTMICLGCNDNETAEYVSKRLGPTTIRVKSISVSKKNGVSESYSPKKRPLLEASEVQNINKHRKNRCIVKIADTDPFLIDKANFLKHPNFKLTGDADESNIMSEEESKIYFCTEPIKVVSYKPVKKQSALVQSSGKTKLGDGETFADEVCGDEQVKAEDIQKAFEPIAPSKKNHSNQEAMEQRSDNSMSLEEIRQSSDIPSTNIIGVSADASEDMFMF